jgi:hypothetical protein
MLFTELEWLRKKKKREQEEKSFKPLPSARFPSK